ncbi:hypothetical protein [Stakelama pacifica]|uniref:Uncharacterized protein n=1 Tax=Stakelama pacifica TaxID=517720 RepID=A0A4R6FJS1_9SPHN|nr:hypothetical protein [Stakelama pacifica]TDN81731.1 hypothetical protein EV664_107133 [Stakelama pacifica]GGO96391.1 hypothetical protein GCM10011329_22810 [Stakelama pacifica]
MSDITKDPRMNAPPRLSDLPREQMMSALYHRAEAKRRDYLDRFCNPKPRLIERIIRRLGL